MMFVCFPASMVYVWFAGLHVACWHPWPTGVTNADDLKPAPCNAQGCLLDTACGGLLPPAFPPLPLDRPHLTKPPFPHIFSQNPPSLHNSLPPLYFHPSRPPLFISPLSRCHQTPCTLKVTTAAAGMITFSVWPERAVVRVCPLVKVSTVMAIPGTTWYCSSCSTHKIRFGCT